MRNCYLFWEECFAIIRKYFLLTRSNQSELDKEEELCGLVINVLFTVMWRGASQPKERGSVIASINMLGKALEYKVVPYGLLFS